MKPFNKHITISILVAFLSCLGVVSHQSYAQSPQTFNGVISNENGPVIGATVLDKDNGKWSITDIDGKFSVEAVEVGHKIEVSCLGYATLAFQWDGKNNSTITLAEQTMELEETVVIGYGAVKKKDLTGAVGIVNDKLISQQSTSQLSQSLQGLVPGLTVTRSSSMPGASASVQIRGVTTMSDSSPLILVDGVAVSSLDNVANEEVQQITVLKDAASASIYGARAAAGVILITTKNASEGQLSVGYNGEFSMITPTELPTYLTSPQDYMNMYNEWAWNDAGNPAGGEYSSYSKDLIDNYAKYNAQDPITYPNYDWKSAILRDISYRHKHNLAMTYGNKVIKTRTSATYENSDALYPGSNHERISVHSRNSINFTKHLSGGVDISYRHATKKDPYSGSPIRASEMYPSIYMATYPDGRIGPGKEGSLSNTYAALVAGGESTVISDNINVKASLSYKPIKGLEISANITPTYGFVYVKQMKKAIPVYDAYDTGYCIGYVSGYNSNTLTEERRNTKALEIQALATYDTVFGKKHNFNAMVGYEEYSYTYEEVTAGSNEMALSSYPYLDLANKNALVVGGSAYQNAYRSVFGRVMYNYDSRYYIQVNARGDASSRFHPDHRWGFFPSVALGYVISNEKFMSNVKDISHLKVRASLGSLGNERIGNYPYQTYISFNKALMYDSTGSKATSQMTGAQQDYAYEDIHWETTWTWDIGIDASFFNNRLDLTADYYYKETKDMLLSVAIPSFTGYSAPEKNLGTMHTNGWEVKIGWHDCVGDFNYGISANVYDYRSVMGDLGGKRVLNSNGTAVLEGEEYGCWYGYKSEGLFQTAEEVASSALLVSSKPGDVKYKDLNGDGIINETYDRAVLGSSLPHFIYGGNINLGWKGISFSMLISGVGYQLSRLTESMVRPLQSQWLSAPSFLLNKDGSRNYWSTYNTAEQNTTVRYPRLSHTAGEANNYKMSDYWLVNSSYCRIKNISLAYTFPSKIIEPAHIQALKVFFNIDDPFCFDNYLPGWDPEAGASTYISRVFTFGLNIKF